MALRRALAERRSVREFSGRAATARELAQLCWAAQGVTSAEGDRTAPSAGGLKPLETWVAMADGLFRYDPDRHRLVRRAGGDARRAVFGAALEQEPILDAAAVFVFAAVVERTAAKYGAAEARRYVLLEAGHAAQSLLLEAVGLGLGGVAIGAFWKARLGRALRLPGRQEPVYVVAVGEPRRAGRRTRSVRGQ